MTPQPHPKLWTRLSRALRRRCPNCGADAFDTYFTMKERCQVCALQFEREPGYWVGATIINTTVIFMTFVVIFVGGVIATWPDVPWTPLLIVLLVVNGLIPVVFYPLSKTLWSAMEMGWNPLDADELSRGDDGL